MTRLPRSLAALLSMGVLLAACAVQTGDTSPSPDGSPTPDTSPSPDTSSSRPARTEPPLATIPPSEEPIIGEVPAEILANIVADASERTGADAAEIDVVQAEAITWTDGSLGCPEPGMAYTQALVDGYHVIVAAGDTEVDYRVGAGGGFRVCEGGRPGG